MPKITAVNAPTITIQYGEEGGSINAKRSPVTMADKSLMEIGFLNIHAPNNSAASAESKDIRITPSACFAPKK